MAKQHGPRAKSAFRRRVNSFLGRLFCKRSIIIISEHKTQHVPFTVGTQFLALVAALGFVGWASYSSGSYMAAQQVLVEKDRTIAQTTTQSERVAAEFALLKRDLSKLAQEENKGKLSDYAKMMTEQLAQEEPTAGQEFAQGLMETDVTEKYNAVFQRIDYLENRVKELQSNHDLLMADIRATTGGKIKELESVIATAGLQAKPLERKVEARRQQVEQQREKYGRIQGGAAGGPYEPLPGKLLKEKETQLYFDLKRAMTLHEIVGALPLTNPMGKQAYRQSSGYGMRIDPFRGALAFHSGLDMAGPRGSKVFATSDGKVTHAGWKNAYGNTVDIEHAYGFTTRYGHLSKVLVKPGQTVRKGQVVAIQGSTGRSTGNHLHYEVRYNDKTLNPKNFLKAGLDVRPVN